MLTIFRLSFLAITVWSNVFVPIKAFVPISEFFPFGTEFGDSIVPTNDDQFVNVTLRYEFPFFNVSHKTLFVNTNGAISFNAGVTTFTPSCGALNQPMIAPFWADIDTNIGGEIYYRESTQQDLVHKATGEILTAFPQFTGLALGWLFIVTWNQVAFYGATSSCNGLSFRNTFQTVLATDGTHSFTIFNYNNITWTTGTHINSGGNCTGLGGKPAKAGFDVGDDKTFYEIPTSCKDEIVHLDEQSNFDVPGKWIFRIDDAFRSASCDNQTIGDQNEKLRVVPSFVSVFGHLPITIHGPCLTNVTMVSCLFNDSAHQSLIEVPGEMVANSSTAVTCIVPYLFSYGRIELKMNITRKLSENNFTQEMYSGYIYSIKPHDDLITGPITQEENGEISLNFTWTPEYFNSTNPDFNPTLNLILVEKVDGKWIERVVLFQGLSNTGRFVGKMNNQYQSDHPFTFKLTVIEADEAKAAAGSFKSLFSPLQYLGEMRDKALNALSCDAWYKSDPGPPTDIPPCPPTTSSAAADPRFKASSWLEDFLSLPIFHPGAEFSFRQRTPSPSGAGQQCVYTKDGNILSIKYSCGTADAVSPESPIGSHFEADVVPYFKCCIFNERSSCDKYFEKRPCDSGKNYVPPPLGNGNGDPHITSFDLTSYTFNGVGEFWMVKSVEFSMQARMEQYGLPNGTLTQASVFTAFAMQTHQNSIIHVQVNLGMTGIAVSIDGVIVESSPQTFTVGGTSVSIDSLSSVSLSFSSGLTFGFKTDDDNLALNIIASANPSLMGKLTGLLGYFDGIPDNDFRRPDGTTLPVTATIQEIHHEFGLKWATLAAESIMEYPRGKNHSSYANPEFEPNFVEPDISKIPENIVKMCARSKVCLFDFVTTGNAALANGTREVEAVFEETRKHLDEKVEMCSELASPKNGSLEGTNYLVGSAVTFSCNDGFDLVGATSTICLKREGVLEWSEAVPLCKIQKTVGAGNTLGNLGAYALILPLLMYYTFA